MSERARERGECGREKERGCAWVNEMPGRLLTATAT